MIKAHKDLQPVSDNLVLWKYMAFDKFLYLIRERKLHFHRIDSFEDTNEGTLSLIDKKLFSYSKESEEWWKRERKRHFANCWIALQYESSLMWNTYAKYGVAICTTVHDLKESLSKDKDRNCYIACVRYIDGLRESSQDGGKPLNILKIFFTKRVYFQQENEFRILYSNYAISDNEDRRGEEISIDTRVLLHEIVISPYANRFIYDLVCNIVIENNINASVRMSNIQI